MESKPRLLAVDDEGDILDMLAKAAPVLDWEFMSCQDPRLAIAAARGFRPDVIVTDVMMPHLDGVELCRAVRADRSLADTVVLLVTGRAGIEDRSTEIVRGLTAGADDYLTKPLHLDELNARVRAWAGRRREKIEAARAVGRAHEQQERLTALIENSRDFIGLAGLDGRVLYVNAAGRAMVGLAPDDDVTTRRVLDFVGPDFAARLAGEILPLMLQQGSASGEGLLRHFGTGHSVPIEYTVFQTRRPGSLNPDGLAVIMRDITERRAARAQLLMERDRAQHYLDVARTIIVALDANGRVTLINRHGLDVLGYAEQEVVGQVWFDRFLPEPTRQQTRRVFDRIMAGEVVPLLQYENPVLTASGGQRLVAWNNSLLRDADGRMVGTLSSGMDITEQRAAETAVRSSEERFRRLFEQSGDAIVLQDAAGRVFDLNRRLCEMTLRERGELLGREVTELFCDEQHDVVRRAMEQTGRTGTARFETRMRQRGGGALDVEVAARLLAGEERLILASARDVSDRKRLQEEQRRYAEHLEQEVEQRTADIRRSEERYRALFENVDHAVVITDLQDRIESWNPAAGRLFGWSQECRGATLRGTLCRKPDCPNHEQVIARARLNGSASHECTARTADGRESPLHIVSSLIRNEQGLAESLFWVISDMSEHERLEDQVRLAREYAARVMNRSGRGEPLLGRSPAWTSVTRFVAEASGVSSPVLIMGESGTGKEVVARAIHENGPRADRPFVVADCAALKGELLESELFGHERGAFTGAHAARRGLAEVADRGTLFVDEIGEMPPELQSKLLRVLERGEYRPLGSSRYRRSDIRILAATNRDLAREVREERFRADLYYRLNVLSITIPPLRLRREDIPILAQHFVGHSRVTATGRKRLHAGAIERLCAYSWPGNVRELANVIERAVIVSGDAEIITEQHLPPDMSGAESPAPVLAGMSLEHVERQAVEAALRTTAGNRTKAAQMLGITRGTLREKLRKYGITDGA